MRYIDVKFPPQASSVNNKHPKGKYYCWLRAHELAVAKGNKTTHLFHGGVNASDVCQGGLGDCWLISAIAALSEYPSLIKQIFQTKETSPFGRYVLRLFDLHLKDDKNSEEEESGKFVDVVVDDLLPCKADGGYPSTLYLKMNDEGEIWPLLIEKALAKWCGSYENLDGGHCAWAMATLTGWPTDSYIKFGDPKPNEKWELCSLTPSKTEPRNPHNVCKFWLCMILSFLIQFGP